MIQTINSNDMSVVKTKNYALVFSADWCGSCHDLIKHMEPLQSILEGKVFNVDIDDNEELSDKYQIKSLPCILVFQDGKEDIRFENNYKFSELMSIISRL